MLSDNFAQRKSNPKSEITQCLQRSTTAVTTQPISTSRYFERQITGKWCKITTADQYKVVYHDISISTILVT